ncbi:chemotaxis protein [Ruminococcus sp. OA3]|uniref:chemotaxis protein n=1 Tax=Ruminococcus sp. OA3 TaxID=2914164 RepID=UPI001F06D8A1|nr:chemotaxis protein [Ruminococcus sp. OA3]MCH1984549.1 chemotaxis protein [Ruminococcus sp. OA3]
MPKGNPKAQTIASEKYQKKAGYISKSYKLKKAVVDEFAVACQRAGVSQAKQLTQMMEDFIRGVE